MRVATLLKKTAFTAMACILITACSENAHDINDTVRVNEENAQLAIDTISPDTNKRTPLQISETPWYGNETIPMKTGKKLPRQLTTANALTLTFSGPVGFREIGTMIESVTRIPVSISNNVYSESLGQISSREFLPAGGQEVSGGRVVWSGSLQDILNQLSNVYGSEWDYKGGVIHFTSEQSKTFMLHALANEITLTGSSSSTAGGESSNIPEIEIDGTTTLEIWNEISEAVENIIGDQGRATFSPSTGSVTVTGRPEVLRRVENYLRYQNQMRLRRVAVSVQVLSIETTDTSSIGLDVGGLIKAALGGDYSVLGAGNGTNGLNASVVSNNILNTAVAGSSNTVSTASNAQGAVLAALNASETVQRASIVHSGSIVTLSDQPAPLQVSRQIAYLARVSSSGGDAASVSLEPDVIETGLFMSVLPRIVEDDRILMRLSVAITDADPNFRQFGTDAIQIELPEVETTGFLQNAVVGNGETLVLAGFEKRSDSKTDNKTPFGFWLGGTRNTNQGRELLVLLINSRILPEQPLTVIGR